DERSTARAAALSRFEPGAKLAVLVPDGPLVHEVFVAAEKAGLVVVGIGPRAGEREIEHLIRATGAAALVAGPAHAETARGLGIPLLDLSDEWPRVEPRPSAPPMASTDLFLLNSTSGTTGLPKIVMHSQARWVFFHRLAVTAADLRVGDVFMSVIPAPFGFGLWTAHFTPALLGSPCVLMQRFDPESCLELIARERVAVLACVSTQFVMLLNSPAFDRHDLSSLRVMFTGGEMVPAERAAEFEDRTGCAVLQFFGSNETGALSGTTRRDPRERRLRTAGRVIPEMNVRLFADDGRDVTGAGGPGVAACRGPTNCYGYYGGDDANGQLYTEDGWMRTGDICTIDADGYLTVAGRSSDFIIRGGKNVSAAVVEDEVASHPAVALAAAVAAPDPVFGERVCVYVELRPGVAEPTLDDLRAHLAARGLGKESWPEHLVVVDTLPRSSGAKIAKGALRADIRRRLGASEQ
ncbi:MAG: acyl--CoA ligase, partial [Actinobacteria bacterium]|nr:acyl--CoA ligase [Actinomycetota bacterium]